MTSYEWVLAHPSESYTVKRTGKGDLPVRSLADRFWAKVEKRSASDCWPWLGARHDDFGYGVLRIYGKPLLAHRAAFLIEHGSLPFIGRHTCDHTWCVNPSHVVDGSVADNNQDTQDRNPNVRSKWTHCIRGHALTGSNLYVIPSNGKRQCRACARIRYHERQENV